MEISKFFSEQLAEFENSALFKSLQDITQNVQIQSDFCIKHPQYKPFELPVKIANRLQKFPIDIQNKYLNQQLQLFIYGIYYNGSLKQQLVFSQKNLNMSMLEENLENNTFLEIDQELYERLHTNNNGKGYFDYGWQLLGREHGDGSIIVTKEGLTLHIDCKYANKDVLTSSENGNLIAVRLPKNKIQKGFYVAIGNAGVHSRNNCHINNDLVRIYFNLCAEGAPIVMSSLTKLLNDVSLPFSFKTLYNPSDYDKRCDCAVLYFEKNNYEFVKSVLKSIYLEHLAYFETEVPLFTKILAPGLGLAEEPNQKFAKQESFGQNRCQIVAKSLLEARQTGNNSPKERMAAIMHNFSLSGVDLQHPYINADSEDIYTSLEL